MRNLLTVVFSTLMLAACGSGTPGGSTEGPPSELPGPGASPLVVASAARISSQGEAPSTCLTVKCTSGFHCEEGAAGAGCFPDAPPMDPSCATVKCSSGFHCEETAMGPSCVADLTCANFNCLVGTCVDTPTGPMCVNDDPCATVKCSNGFHCEASGAGASCVPDVCPTPFCVAPPVGCGYVGGNLSGPCETWTCGKLVCPTGSSDAP